MFQSNEERASLVDAQAAAMKTRAPAESESVYVQPGEELPFRVRVVRTQNQLLKAIHVRAGAYSRHTPGFGDLLRVVEQDDTERHSLVLLCESKLTGDAIGTLRIQTNFDAPTYLEKVLPLPDFFCDAGIAYVTRLAVTNGANGSSVKLALFKALYRYCLATQISWILAVARDPVERDFVRLGFQDILPAGRRLHRPEDFGDVTVRPLYFSVLDAESKWRASGHPLYDFMIRKLHTDIEIFTSVSSAWATPRRQRTTSTAGSPSLEFAQIMAV